MDSLHDTTRFPFKKDSPKRNKRIQELKDLLEKDHGRPFTWEEASKEMDLMELLAEAVMNGASKEMKLAEQLETSQEGFHPEEGGTCPVCGTYAKPADAWYDKFGLKCMTCQKAIDKKIIPVSVATDKESWYSKFDLENYFNIKGKLLNKLIKEGSLKVREIPGEGRQVHFHVFLMKENKGVLPPKKMFPKKHARIERNGEWHYTILEWYEFIDKSFLKKLCKYKIAECLEESFAQPVTMGRFYYTSIDPLFAPKEEDIVTIKPPASEPE